VTKEKLISIAKGACVAAIGAMLTYLAADFSGINFGIFTPLVTAALSVLTNAVRKWAEKS